MLTDTFIKAACVPLDDSHVSGTLDEARQILADNPAIVYSSIYTAAVVGNAITVKQFLEGDPSLATQKGGPHNWDALTYLCFSRYLRSGTAQNDGFVHAAKLLLDAGADANTGWYEHAHLPNPEWEPVLYGAAGIAHHPELTRLLIDHGADPNDIEVVYHTPETYDNRCMKLLLDTGRLADENIILMLIRKHDLHDAEGVKMILATGVDPNIKREPGHSALLHGIARDNNASIIQLLLEHGADPTVSVKGKSPIILAARRGRNDLLAMFEQYGFSTQLDGVDKLVAACAKNDIATIEDIRRQEPELVTTLLKTGTSLLAEFAGTDNEEGVRNLLALGVPVAALYSGDAYFGIPHISTALHVAAWKACHKTVACLIKHDAPVNIVDVNGRTPLMLAIRACVNSYWQYRRTTTSIELLLNAGASMEGVVLPTGYDEADKLFENRNSK